MTDRQIRPETLTSLKLQVLWAREHVTSPRRLPGSRQFREDWHRYGPDDVEFAVEAYRTNESALLGARAHAKKERQLTQRLQELASVDPSASDQSSLSPEEASEAQALRGQIADLQEEWAQLRRTLSQLEHDHTTALTPLQQEVAELEAQAQELERELEERRKAVEERKAAVAAKRQQLEEAQGAIGRLQPRVRAAQQHYGLEHGKGQR